jgi:hypothetical protein
MAIGVYFQPVKMSQTQYEDILSRLEKAGQGKPAGRSYHCSFGDPNALMVFDIWDSQEQFDKFGATLMPILSEVGVDPGKPDIMPINKVITG